LPYLLKYLGECQFDFYDASLANDVQSLVSFVSIVSKANIAISALKCLSLLKAMATRQII
jgi:hypothetical protein